MIRRTTFRRRLAVAMTALAVGVLAVTEGAVYLAVERALDRDIDMALLAIASAEIASAFDEPGIGPHVHDATLAPMGLVSSETEKVAMLLDRDGRILAHTHGRAAELTTSVDHRLLDQALSQGSAFRTIASGTETYRVLYRSFLAPDRATLVTMVALPRVAAARTLGKLRAVLAVALVAGAGAAGLGAKRLARHLTHPLERIADAAHGIDTALGDARIPEVSQDAEIHELVAILNQMLERVSAAASAQQRFVADASHELRSPLTNLRGAIDVALRRPRTADDYRETLTTAQTEIERLVRLTRALLTLSRVDAGQVILSRGCCELNDVVRASVVAHRARAEEAGLEIRLALTEPSVIDGDADRLREVVDNLLDNALRHSPRGAELLLTTALVDRRVRLTVEDRGPGVPVERHARIFERFERADESRDRASGGFGLGLAIVRAIVEAHGGEISVRNRPGGGASFEVRLPAAPVSDTAPTEP